MVSFNPEGHKYYNEKKQEYISATTFVGKFKKPFDTDYWSKYKAIERFIVSTRGEQDWKSGKGKITKENIDLVIQKLGSYKIHEIVGDIIIEWNDKKELGCERGTKIHLTKEVQTYKDKGINVFTKFIELQELGRQKLELLPGVYPELLLWNDEYRIAGTSDIVIIYPDKYFSIDDYKSNKKIDTNPYRNHKTGEVDSMLHPIQHLGNCNYIHYCLQANVYAWMLISHGYKLRSMQFSHCITANPSSEIILDTKIYSVPNFQNEIEEMARYYRNK